MQEATELIAELFLALFDLVAASADFIAALVEARLDAAIALHALIAAERLATAIALIAAGRLATAVLVVLLRASLLRRDGDRRGSNGYRSRSDGLFAALIAVVVAFIAAAGFAAAIALITALLPAAELIFDLVQPATILVALILQAALVAAAVVRIAGVTGVRSDRSGARRWWHRIGTGQTRRK